MQTKSPKTQIMPSKSRILERATFRRTSMRYYMKVTTVPLVAKFGCYLCYLEDFNKQLKIPLQNFRSSSIYYKTMFYMEK